MLGTTARWRVFISDLEWFVMPPILLRQFRLFYAQDRPIGVLLLGHLNEEVEAGLHFVPLSGRVHGKQSMRHRLCEQDPPREKGVRIPRRADPKACQGQANMSRRLGS